MKSKTAFTKKDFFVVLGCVVFLLASIGAVGNSGRRRAKEAVCLSNLRQWGAIFECYTNDHDGYFNHGRKERVYQGGYWFVVLRPYYRDTWDLLLCPTTTKRTEDGWDLGTFKAWVTTRGGITFIGSYGINSWTNYLTTDTAGHNRKPEYHWKGIHNVKNANNIPVLGDSTHIDGWPWPNDEPPPIPEFFGIGGGHDEMRHWCIDRHNGGINMLFMDWSARKVGLKELWTLKWHREFDTEGPWTLAGFDGDIEAYNAAWYSFAPWMKDFKAF